MLERISLLFILWNANTNQKILFIIHNKSTKPFFRFLRSSRLLAISAVDNGQLNELLALIVIKSRRQKALDERRRVAKLRIAQVLIEVFGGDQYVKRLLQVLPARNVAQLILAALVLNCLSIYFINDQI